MNAFLILMGLTVSEFPFVRFVLTPFLLAFFFVFCYTYDIMKSAFLSVPTAVTCILSLNTQSHTPESCYPHARTFIICFFGLNCRNFTISPVNHSWSFLPLHCSSFSSPCAIESSLTIISRDAFGLYVIAPRIRKRKDGTLYFGYVYSKDARKTFSDGRRGLHGQK